MKPRKIQILKNFLANDEKAWTNPLNYLVIEGLIKLFEWDQKILEVFPSIDPDIKQYIQKAKKTACPGYYCSYSENYMIEDQSAAKPFECPEDEEMRNIFNLAFLSSSACIRDLAIVYRSRMDVRELVDGMIDSATSEAKEKRSFKNILRHAHFMSDFQCEELRNQVIRNFKEDRQ